MVMVDELQAFFVERTPRRLCLRDLEQRRLRRHRPPQRPPEQRVVPERD